MIKKVNVTCNMYLLVVDIFISNLSSNLMLTSGSISKSIPDKADTNKTKISRQTNIIDILIMGDSIAKGTGDEMGKGFSDYLPESLKNKTGYFEFKMSEQMG